MNTIMGTNNDTTETQDNLHYTRKNSKKRASYFIYSLCCITISLLSITSCNKHNKPEETADYFLKAYLATEYKKAVSYCTPQLSGYLMESVKELDELDPEIKAKIIESTADLTTKINSVEKNDEGDSVKINYSIIKSNPTDSTIKIEIKNRLYMVKEKKVWKVASLN